MTGSGVPVLLTLKSASPAAATAIFTVAALLPVTVSWVVVVTVSVSEIIVLAAVPAFTFTTTWKLAVVEAAMVATLQVTFPTPPTTGKVQDQVAGVTAETKVVLAGTVSVKTSVDAVAGPLFVTVWV